MFLPRQARDEQTQGSHSSKCHHRLFIQGRLSCRTSSSSCSSRCGTKSASFFAPFLHLKRSLSQDGKVRDKHEESSLKRRARHAGCPTDASSWCNPRPAAAASSSRGRPEVLWVLLPRQCSRQSSISSPAASRQPAAAATLGRPRAKQRKTAAAVVFSSSLMMMGWLPSKRRCSAAMGAAWSCWRCGNGVFGSHASI